MRDKAAVRTCGIPRLNLEGSRSVGVGSSQLLQLRKRCDADDKVDMHGAAIVQASSSDAYLALL